MFHVWDLHCFNAAGSSVVEEEKSKGEYSEHHHPTDFHYIYCLIVYQGMGLGLVNDYDSVSLSSEDEVGLDKDKGV